MSKLLRFLVVYGWAEDFELAKHPDVLARLVEDARISPTKLGVAAVADEKSRRRTLSRKSRLVDVIAPFTSYERVSLDEPVARDLTDLRSHLSVDLSRRRYVLTKCQSEFTLGDAVGHLRLLCSYITPRYGFLHSEHGLVALTFPHGITTTGLSRAVFGRISDLGQSIGYTREHLNGKLHDVYLLNVLSPLHLGRLVSGKPLGDWISVGDRGELLEIQADVTAWIVPDKIRPGVRAMLLEEGALITSA